MAVLPAAREIASVACLMLGEIGDLLVTTPAIGALRRRYPGARLTAIVGRRMVPLLRANPDVDEILAYDNRSPLHKLVHLARLAGRRWDLWVDLHVPTFNTICPNSRVYRRNALMMRVARSRFRLGFAVPELAPHLTHPVPTPSAGVLSSENIARTTLRLLDGGDGIELRKLLRVPERERAWARRFLAEGPHAGHPRMALFFGAKQPADWWPDDHVQALCARIVDRYPDHRFLLIGGPHERAARRRWEAATPAAIRSRVQNLIARTSLLQTAALLEACESMVTTDSGPMHMADALGVPLVVLFSSKLPLPIWLPLSRPAEALNVLVPCGPCLSSVCHNASLCMRSISPDDVLAALERVRRAAAAGR